MLKPTIILDITGIQAKIFSSIRQELPLLKNKTSVTLQWIPFHCGVGGRLAVKNGKQVGAICTLHALQRSKGHPKKQLQDRVATTPRHWDRRRQHPPAGQSSSSHNLLTENWTLSTSLPPPQTEIRLEITVPVGWALNTNN